MNNLLTACLITASISAPVQAQTIYRDPQVCVVWDPQDTYANVRSSPNGAVIDTRENGRQIEVVGIAYDEKGRPWVDFVSRGSSGHFILQSLVGRCIPGAFGPDGRIMKLR